MPSTPPATLTLAAATEPLISNPAIDWFKDIVNRLSVPEISLPIFVVLFILMFWKYREWTKPKLAVPLLALFSLFYFGSMAIDVNYLEIIKKPDNVPITMMVFGTLFCLWVGLRQAAANDERIKEGKPLIEAGKDDKVLVWPDLIYTELICLLIGSIILVVWSVLLRAPLEAPANPAGPPNPSKAPWYFLGLQEMLVYFDPWMAGVLLPGMIVSGLIAMPYMDVNPKGNGYYTISQRKFAIWTWMFGFLILWVVLIVYGTFLRGPNWNFFGPYEPWDAHMQVPLTNWNLSDYVWVSMLGQPLPSNPIVREFVGIVFVAGWLLVIPVVLARTVMRRMYQQMGMVRFAILAIHLVIMALMPLKMILRWFFTLKYFVYLPEFNLNL